MHSGQRMEVSESWPYLATPRMVPAVKIPDPTAPQPARDPETPRAAAPPTPDIPVPPVPTPYRTPGVSFINSDVTKLLLFVAAACGAILLFDISAKTFMGKK